jgi:hypothetical protein
VFGANPSRRDVTHFARGIGLGIRGLRQIRKLQRVPDD